MIELWHRLRKRGYKRCPESLFRVMKKMGMFPSTKPKKKYQPTLSLIVSANFWFAL
jgi:hypothetical protein